MLKNRVDPWGVLNAVTDRGALMGNRGILHNEKKRGHPAMGSQRLGDVPSELQGSSPSQALFCR